jgi:hypothetical protein
MPESAPLKPVFIDAMPDYQEAMKAIVTLSQNRKAFASVAQELGLGDELQKVKDRLEAMKPQALELVEKQNKLDVRLQDATGSLVKKSGVVGTLTGALGGVGGYKLGSRWGTIKGVVAGLVSAALVGVVSFYTSIKVLAGRKKELGVLTTEYASIKAQEDQFLLQSMEMQQQFMAQMATKMLSERKMLVGQGTDAKLVPNPELYGTSEPTPASSMAEKYAASPAATHADAALKSQNAAVQQR